MFYFIPKELDGFIARCSWILTRKKHVIRELVMHTSFDSPLCQHQMCGDRWELTAWGFIVKGCDVLIVCYFDCVLFLRPAARGCFRGEIAFMT